MRARAFACCFSGSNFIDVSFVLSSCFPSFGPEYKMHLRKFVLALMGLTCATAVAIIAFGGYLSAWINCAIPTAYTSGKIIAFENLPISEPNVHGSTQPDYHLGSRPLIRLEMDGTPRIVKADEEQAPASRRIGDSVRVCFDRRDAERVHIIEYR